MKVAACVFHHCFRWGLRNPFLLFLLFLLIPVTAQTIPDGLQNLRGRFGTDTTAADFIFVINNSSVLNDAGVFAELRIQLPQVVEALSPVDNFILIGFDAHATTMVSACPVGDNSLPFQSAIFRMKDPRGRAGKLQEGLSAALATLNRPGHAPLQLLFLILDGDLVARDNGGPPPDSLTWEVLAKHYADWQGESLTEVYGLVVGDHSDMQIVRMIFPEIRFLETSAASLHAFLERWRAELPSRKLRLHLADEIAHGGLTVHPIGPAIFRDRETITDVRIRVRSRFRRLSVVLPYTGQWRAFSGELKLTPRYEDFPLTLAPKESRDLMISISRPTQHNLGGCWHGLKRDPTPVQISFIPAMTLVDRALVRGAGVEEPSSREHKLAVEIVWQHGQPAWLLWLIMGSLCLMTISLVGSWRYGIAGTDFVVVIVSRQSAKLRRLFSPGLLSKLSFPQSVKSSFISLHANPGLSSVIPVTMTLMVLWSTERWGGKSGLGFSALLLFVFWAAVVFRQLRYFPMRKPANVSPQPRQQKIQAQHGVQPSLHAIARKRRG